MNRFARLLNNVPQVDDFLTVALGLDTSNLHDINSKIVTCEKGVLDGIENPTSTSKSFRDKKYSDNTVRIELRRKIVDELFTKTQLKNDDLIAFGKGGAMPKKLSKTKQAFFLMGLPASGKSTVANMIAEKYGAVILDSDFAKRKLPEYGQYPWGASLVNEESSIITFGDKSETGFSSLFERAIENKYNVIIPKVGSEPESIIPYCESLKAFGYKVHLTLVYLPKEKSTVRALFRFVQSNRYVPLAVIFDVFSNNPALTYFKLKNRKLGIIDSYGIVNTDVQRKKPFFCTDLLGKNPANMFEKRDNALI